MYRFAEQIRSADLSISNKKRIKTWASPYNSLIGAEDKGINLNPNSRRYEAFDLLPPPSKSKVILFSAFSVTLW